MKISVEVPTLELRSEHDKVELHVGPGQTLVTIDYGGNVYARVNGGSHPATLTINVLQLLKELQEKVGIGS
jgi:hypothetical protein